MPTRADDVYQTTFDSILAIINNCNFMQAQVSQEFKIKNSKAYLKEYCMFKFYGPRQSGHTTTINRISKEIDSWVIFNNIKMLENFKDRFNRCDNLYTIGQIINILKGDYFLLSRTLYRYFHM